ncbi:Enoyl-CoA hydratase/isomerase [Dillenia turbinata]|uniref:Enoyl-CoA hydratase/isomerase n=1 Tax=Dillenia turbinata TaxID=194707 RepID=A0AAN8UWT8_9MAGN
MNLNAELQTRRLPKPVIAMVGSFDAGLRNVVSYEIYSASEAEKLGLISPVVLLENLEKETVQWCREILSNSPTAIRVLKSALNAVDDGHAGMQELSGNAALMFYATEEDNERKKAYMIS